MSKDLLKSTISLLLLSLFGFVINKAILYFIDFTSHYHYPLEYYYLLFAIVAMAIIYFLIFIGKKSITYIGYSFLWLSIIQMVVCGILINTSFYNLSKIERTNFFMICLYFLAVETFLSVKILNKPQAQNKTNKNQ